MAANAGQPLTQEGCVMEAGADWLLSGLPWLITAIAALFIHLLLKRLDEVDVAIRIHWEEIKKLKKELKKLKNS